jgi:HSP20 family protein
VDEEREPITDLFDEESEIVVIVEMPGIEEKDLEIELKGDMLDIKAVSKSRSYRKELLLPATVGSENLSHKFTNGILEIRIKK